MILEEIKKKEYLYNITKIGFLALSFKELLSFPKAFIEDDVGCREAVKFNILLVPDRIWNTRNFRMSYSVDKKTIINSLPAFEELAKKFIG